MNGPVSGAMYQPREHRPSDDDRDEAAASVEYAAEALDVAISALNGAHLQCESYLGYSPIKSLFDLDLLRVRHAALVERHGLMQRRRTR
jgi:hypothetical protein